ncbi:hypothetical protein BH23ACT2_BH23ACT2_16210 [soil metagenome]
MGRIRVSTVIDASPAQVWEEVRHIDRHVHWMADAEAIRFRTAQTSGTGTEFDCITKVGPIRLTDTMTITEWRDGREMGVCHEGLVTGRGRFTLARARGGRTRFRWEERLTFPWWLGGAVGGVVGGRVMRRIWKRNLQALKAVVEDDRA